MVSQSLPTAKHNESCKLLLIVGILPRLQCDEYLVHVMSSGNVFARDEGPVFQRSSGFIFRATSVASEELVAARTNPPTASISDLLNILLQCI
jgi:hypothetical protein